MLLLCIIINRLASKYPNLCISWAEESSNSSLKVKQHLWHGCESLGRQFLTGIILVILLTASRKGYRRKVVNLTEGRQPNRHCMSEQSWQVSCVLVASTESPAILTRRCFTANGILSLYLYLSPWLLSSQKEQTGRYSVWYTVLHCSSPNNYQQENSSKVSSPFKGVFAYVSCMNTDHTSFIKTAEALPKFFW